MIHIYSILIRMQEGLHPMLIKNTSKPNVATFRMPLLGRLKTH